MLRVHFPPLASSWSLSAQSGRSAAVASTGTPAPRPDVRAYCREDRRLLSMMQSQRSLMGFLCSGCPNFGKQPDRIGIAPTGCGFLLRARGKRVEISCCTFKVSSGLVKHRVKAGDITLRRVLVDQRDTISGHAPPARMRIAMGVAGLKPSGQPMPSDIARGRRCSKSIDCSKASGHAACWDCRKS